MWRSGKNGSHRCWGCAREGKKRLSSLPFEWTSSLSAGQSILNFSTALVTTSTVECVYPHPLSNTGRDERTFTFSWIKLLTWKGTRSGKNGSHRCWGCAREGKKRLSSLPFEWTSSLSAGQSILNFSTALVTTSTVQLLGLAPTHTRQRQTRWFTSGLSLTRVLSWISAKPIVYRLFSILNSDLIHNNLRFYNVWIYSRSHSATRIIRAACYRKFYFDFPSPLLAYSPLAKPARVPLTQLIPLFHTRIHTFNIVSLLLA